MFSKLELRQRQKALRATLPDVSRLVCGHLVQWIGAWVDSQKGEPRVRPYKAVDENMGDVVELLGDVEKTVSPTGQTQGSAPTTTNTVQTIPHQKIVVSRDNTFYTNQNQLTVGANPRVRPANQSPQTTLPRNLYARLTNQPIILLYKAFASEISLESLPENLPDIQFLTTRVANNQTLTLHDFSSATVKNRFGILEPPPNTPEFAPDTVDIALIPGLAFTPHGGRLGYGGGFYDRLLPQLRPDCLLVGVTHSGLLLPDIPLEPHDVAMHFLALETGVVAAI
jgi:5-formyltetrahydrofolate cyclo-ligase